MTHRPKKRDPTLGFSSVVLVCYTNTITLDHAKLTDQKGATMVCETAEIAVISLSRALACSAPGGGHDACSVV